MWECHVVEELESLVPHSCCSSILERKRKGEAGFGEINGALSAFGETVLQDVVRIGFRAQGITLILYYCSCVKYLVCNGLGFIQLNFDSIGDLIVLLV